VEKQLIIPMEEWNGEFLLDYGMNVNMLNILGEEDGKKMIYIYKSIEDKWWLINKLDFEKGEEIMMSEIGNGIYLCHYPDDILVIKEYDMACLWKGKYLGMMEKREIILTGELALDIWQPNITINLDEIELGKMREDFYYREIPFFNINLYDMETHTIRNDIIISNIEFGEKKLEFNLSFTTPVKCPYNLIVYLTISYLVDT
jgi:hypothetical protein